VDNPGRRPPSGRFYQDACARSLFTKNAFFPLLVTHGTFNVTVRPSTPPPRPPPPTRGSARMAQFVKLNPSNSQTDWCVDVFCATSRFDDRVGEWDVTDDGPRSRETRPQPPNPPSQETVFRDGNVGVLCVRRRRNADPTRTALDTAAVPPSEFSGNQLLPRPPPHGAPRQSMERQGWRRQRETQFQGGGRAWRNGFPNAEPAFPNADPTPPPGGGVQPSQGAGSQPAACFQPPIERPPKNFAALVTDEEFF